ncbi:MAG TPA: ABC transporter substrate-binding protein [Anaeromyxobacter sp.]|nr:ABC transporter substrate-binding protein [Anaeromyxobacter sp.]
MRTTRRRTLLSLPLAVLAAAWAAPARGQQQKGPVKVGLLTPQTGPLAANGKDMQNGFQLFLEQHGNKLGGRDVALLVEDDAGVPATGLTKLRSMVESQGVQVLVGPLSAAVGYAIAPYINERKLPTLFPIVSSEDLTQRKRSRYIVRTGWTSAQPSQPFGKYAYDTLHYKRIAMIGYDFAFGWEVAAGFHRTFEEAGGQIVQKLWSPLGTADYGPYLAQLRRDVDAIYAIFSGADALRFMKQYADAGLKGRIPLIGGGTFTDEHVLRNMGDEALGVVTCLHYSAALDDPANKKFAQAYEAKFGQVPSYYSEGAYVAGLALAQAMDAVRGNVEDVEKLIDALRKVDLSETPRGPVKLDSYGNPVENEYVRKVEKVNGRLQNTVIHTFPAVSQFWTYKPEDFLKQPVYGRDVPPCTHCGK